MHTELASQLPAALVVSFIIQWLKGQKWFPLVTMETEKLNRVVSALGAFFVVLGIHFQFDSTAGVLTITGLKVASLAHFSWDWITQFAMQHATYQKLIKNGGFNGKTS